MNETLGVSPISGEKSLISGFEHGLGLSEVDGGRRQESNAGVVMLVVVPVEEFAAQAKACSNEPKRSGKSGRYFKVLN